MVQVDTLTLRLKVDDVFELMTRCYDSYKTFVSVERSRLWLTVTSISQVIVHLPNLVVVLTYSGIAHPLQFDTLA